LFIIPLIENKIKASHNPICGQSASVVAFPNHNILLKIQILNPYNLDLFVFEPTKTQPTNDAPNAIERNNNGIITV